MGCTVELWKVESKSIQEAVEFFLSTNRFLFSHNCTILRKCCSSDKKFQKYHWEILIWFAVCSQWDIEYHWKICLLFHSIKWKAQHVYVQLFRVWFQKVLFQWQFWKTRSMKILADRTALTINSVVLHLISKVKLRPLVFIKWVDITRSNINNCLIIENRMEIKFWKGLKILI